MTDRITVFKAYCECRVLEDWIRFAKENAVPHEDFGEGDEVICPRRRQPFKNPNIDSLTQEVYDHYTQSPMHQLGHEEASAKIENELKWTEEEWTLEEWLTYQIEQSNKWVEPQYSGSATKRCKTLSNELQQLHREDYKRTLSRAVESHKRLEETLEVVIGSCNGFMATIGSKVRRMQREKETLECIYECLPESSAASDD